MRLLPVVGTLLSVFASSGVLGCAGGSLGTGTIISTPQFTINSLNPSRRWVPVPVGTTGTPTSGYAENGVQPISDNEALNRLEQDITTAIILAYAKQRMVSPVQTTADVKVNYRSPLSGGCYAVAVVASNSPVPECLLNGDAVVSYCSICTSTAPALPQMTPLDATLTFEIMPQGSSSGLGSVLQPMSQQFYQDLADTIYIELVSQFGAKINGDIVVSNG